MFLEDDFSTAQEGGIVISAYQELLDERASNDEFCWGYYLRIENNSNDTISLLGKKHFGYRFKRKSCIGGV